MMKLADDPCFGQLYNTHEQCGACWIKRACNVAWKNRKDYLEKPEVLREALDDYERWSELYGPSSDEYSSPSSSDEDYYFWLKTQLDQNDSDLKAKFNKVEELAKEIGNSISFFKIN